MLSSVAVIGSAEVRLLVRNKATATMALALPLAAGAYLALRPPDLGAGTERLAWTWIVTTQVLLVLGFTVYITSTSAFAARRQALVLKRLRSGEATDAAILTGLAIPAVLLGLAQIALVVGLSVFGGLPLPSTWWPLVLAVVGGAAMCAAAGVLTSGFTPGAESAQITTAPFFFALLMGGILVMREAGEAGLPLLLLPGGAVAEFLRLAWAESGVPAAEAATAAGVLLLWIVMPTALAARTFRWTPRS